MNMLLVTVEHAEVYRSQSGETIAVRCTCGLGRDHSYAEWVEAMAFQDVARARTVLAPRSRG
ncbi:hypothetical protein [Leifsonia poae]|uniref:hypothetical protein n=1 Tax=Leifsonia poae TaxID=110933 RepID=UPI001CC08A2A|nr:hypothetical protein [Leifsonia poae]